MNTTPDPKTVREIAREFLLDDDLGPDELDYAVRRHINYTFPEEEFQAWRDAVDADAQEGTVTKTASWPDEQPQDDGDVRAVRALTQAASRMLGTWAEANDDVRRELWTTLHDRADDAFDRFREQYAALDAKAPRERVAELAEHAEEER